MHARCRRLSTVHENRMLGGKWKRYKAGNGTRVNQQVTGSPIKLASQRMASPPSHRITEVEHQGAAVEVGLTEVVGEVAVEEVSVAAKDQPDMPPQQMRQTVQYFRRPLKTLLRLLRDFLVSLDDASIHVYRFTGSPCSAHNSPYPMPCTCTLVPPLWQRSPI